MFQKKYRTLTQLEEKLEEIVDSYSKTFDISKD